MWIESFCDFPFNRVRIDCEGNVTFCCFQRPDPLRPEQEAYLGNVLEKSFDDIWFGDLAEEIRETTLKGELHAKCQCPGCPLLSLKKPYPLKHVVYNEYPNFLEVDLPNTHCNIGGPSPDPVKSPACIMCERSAPFFRPQVSHLDEVLERIKYLTPNLYQIHIQGIAEPFYRTRKDGFLLFDVMDKLGFDDFADQITISVTTNGTLLREEVRKEYLKRAPHSITNFSIDAATAPTYKVIRILDCFDKVLANMYAFDRDRVRDRQFLRMTNNINTINVHEVVGMCHIAQLAHAEYIEFNVTDGFNHVILVNRTNCGQFARAQQSIIEECEKIGLPYSFLRPLDLGLTTEVVLI